MQVLRNIYYLTIKELRVLLGDPVMVGLIIFMFTGMIMGAAGKTKNVRNAQVAVVDLDHSTLSHRVVAALQPPEFQRPIYTDSATADRLMNSGTVNFIIHFPPHF